MLQDVRENWLGLGVATVFKSWKTWVREQLKARRQDRRAKLRAKINVCVPVLPGGHRYNTMDGLTKRGAVTQEWSTFQASLDIARMRLGQWHQLIDPLSDHAYWQNEVTGTPTSHTFSNDDYDDIQLWVALPWQASRRGPSRCFQIFCHRVSTSRTRLKRPHPTRN